MSAAQFGTMLHWLHVSLLPMKNPGLQSTHACSPVRVQTVAPAAQLAASRHGQSSVAGQCVVDERMGDTLTSQSSLSTVTPLSSQWYSSAGSEASDPQAAGHVAMVSTQAYDSKGITVGLAAV
jgi:hypothetical protein